MGVSISVVATSMEMGQDFIAVVMKWVESKVSELLMFR